MIHTYDQYYIFRYILTLGAPVIVSKTSTVLRELNATSSKASLGQSKNQSIVVQFTNEGY